MRNLSGRSTQRLLQPTRMKNSALLAAALPVMCGALGCGGSASTSQVAGGDSGNTLQVADGGNAGISQVVGSAGATFTPSSTDLNINPNPGSSSGSGGTGSTTGPAPYMLPPDFTPEMFGGYKLGASEDPTMPSAAAGASAGKSGCGTQILGVVRDFKGMNEPLGHPDFEHFSGNGPSPGIVDADLGSDRKPVYSATGAFTDLKHGPQTTTKANFDQWYRATPNVNKPYVVYLYFQPNAGVLTFESTAFFRWMARVGVTVATSQTRRVRSRHITSASPPRCTRRSTTRVARLSRLPVTMTCGCSSIANWRSTSAGCTQKPASRSRSTRSLRSSESRLVARTTWISSTPNVIPTHRTSASTPILNLLTAARSSKSRR